MYLVDCITNERKKHDQKVFNSKLFLWEKFLRILKRMQKLQNFQLNEKIVNNLSDRFYMKLNLNFSKNLKNQKKKKRKNIKFDN